MALGSIQDREFTKFVEVNNLTHIRTTDSTTHDKLDTLTTAIGAPKIASIISSGSGSGLNTILYNGDVSDYSSISVQLTGTFVSTVTFEGSNDNTNWVIVNGQTVSSGTTTVAQSMNGTNQIFKIGVYFKYFRLRISAYTSGTVNYLLFISTNESDVPGATVVGVSGAVQTLSFAQDWGTYSGSALNAILTPVGVEYYTYSKVSLQIYGTFVAELSFEASNDNTNWYAVKANNISNARNVYTTTSTGLYEVPISFKYFRVRISSYTSGTVSCRSNTNAADFVDFYPAAPVKVNSYSDDQSVSASTTAEIHSYTVPANKSLALDFIYCSGQNIAEYLVKVDAVKIASARTYFGSNIDIKLEFNGYVVATGSEITVEVVNFRNSVASFSARICGDLSNA